MQTLESTRPESAPGTSNVTRKRLKIDVLSGIAVAEMQAIYFESSNANSRVNKT